MTFRHNQFKFHPNFDGVFATYRSRSLARSLILCVCLFFLLLAQYLNLVFNALRKKKKINETKFYVTKQTKRNTTHTTLEGVAKNGRSRRCKKTIHTQIKTNHGSISCFTLVPSIPFQPWNDGKWTADRVNRSTQQAVGVAIHSLFAVKIWFAVDSQIKLKTSQPGSDPIQTHKWNDCALAMRCLSCSVCLQMWLYYDYDIAIVQQSFWEYVWAVVYCKIAEQLLRARTLPLTEMASSKCSVCISYALHIFFLTRP